VADRLLDRYNLGAAALVWKAGFDFSCRCYAASPILAPQQKKKAGRLCPACESQIGCGVRFELTTFGL
jgi:hypothetical protein